MAKRKLHYRSRSLPASRSGMLVEITPERAGWKYIRFGVRQLARGARWSARADGEECALVLLSGACRVRVDDQEWSLGPRRSVFEAYPYAAYLPNGSRFSVEARERSELAVCRAPSRRRDFAPRLVRPQNCGLEVRGGGNATRQIVDVLPPAFPADRLLICEVFTPSGNWSSYPPHKHDVDAPPHEVDLEETYYFKMRQPDGYGFQRLYTANGRFDHTFKVQDGDLLLIRDGYHPFVTAYGYDAYYLNVLAGSRRSMAASDDPRYAPLRKSWPPPDPRVPMLRPPPAATAGERA
ncbi:MAG: 5-deoxy-glucuronate isomerase [Vicinamibacteria bacterium]